MNCSKVLGVLITFFERLNVSGKKCWPEGTLGQRPGFGFLPDGVWKGTIGIQARADTLEKEAARLTVLRVQVEQTKSDKEMAERDLAAIPRKDMLDRILRYENSNRRHRYQIEARLDELQERRRRKDAKTGLATNGDPESPKKT